MSLVVVGTMAFDAIETPFGKTDKILVALQRMLPTQQQILQIMCNWFRLLDMIFRKRN